MNQHSAGAKNPIQHKVAPPWRGINCLASQKLGLLENFLTLYLVTKAPYAIPSSVKGKIVAIAPWIDLFLLVVSLPLLAVLFGLNFAFFSFAWPMGAYASGGWGFVNIVAFAALILEFLAIPGLFQRKKYAWTLVMYAALFTIVKNLVFFSIGGILGGIIGLYILFQVKEYYK